MDPSRALGLWQSNFGPVKIEADLQRGPSELMGVWVYDRDGQEIIGFFSGRANGTVLNFNWEEPSAQGPLRGAGYLSFDPNGSTFNGRWWTDNRDRGGEWNGWREGAAAAPANGTPDPNANPDPGADPYGNPAPANDPYGNPAPANDPYGAPAPASDPYNNPGGGYR